MSLSPAAEDNPLAGLTDLNLSNNTASSSTSQATVGLSLAQIVLSPSPDNDSLASSTELNQSDTISSSSSDPSAVSICPHCYNNIQSPSQNRSPTHPISLANPHIDVVTFKDNVNAALEGRLHT